ncbi:MAG: EamA family transporter [Pseudomonadales bacterium]
MFFLLAIISTIAYSLQSSLLVKHARSMDKLSLAFYRMLSLSVVLLPLLLGVDQHDYQQLAPLTPNLMLSGLCGGLFLWTQFYALKFIAVGVATSLNQSARTLVAFILGFVLLEQSVASVQAVLVLAVLSGGALVAISKNSMPHLQGSPLQGIVVSILGGCLGAVTFYILSSASKQANPFMIGYFWELSIFFGACCILILRYLFTGVALERISRRDFIGIAAASSPTLIGTATAALALKSGPLAIFVSIASLSVILSALFARLLYAERLRSMQWLGILISLTGVIGLKIFS